MTTQEIYNLKYKVTEMSTLSAAKSFSSKCVKAHAVLHGDNGKFWVACYSDAQRLQKAGYEVVAA